MEKGGKVDLPVEAVMNGGSGERALKLVFVGHLIEEGNWVLNY